MPTVKTIQLPGPIRVAVVIEQGRIKPVWFEQTDRLSRERIFIKEVCSLWDHMEGAAKVISFAVWDGANKYVLALNTKAFTWTLEVAEIC
ncbi:hypothetical protein [Geobacter sp. AOG2]|uniref:hypothetical protein n=1 Tax=Geobacter sp. AOG2 TaxID=1566347 RepID=UPI001CC4B309|nr:hypothetical protein [Geobacter sp. AOG2]GFE62894.1 hypothetical protein AOG2_34830 [Geobacter sp. AOG2]